MKNTSLDFPWRAARNEDLQRCSQKRFLIALTFVGSVQAPFIKKVYVEELWKRAEGNTNILQTGGSYSLLPQVPGALFRRLDH